MKKFFNKTKFSYSYKMYRKTRAYRNRKKRFRRKSYVRSLLGKKNMARYPYLS